MNIMNRITTRGLVKNRTRTIVTIIGVILSAAMFTAVTAFISSLQNYALNYTIYQVGDWHGTVKEVTYEDYERLLNNDKIKQAVLTRSGGYSLLNGSRNENKPYLHVLEMEKDAFNT